MGGWVGGWWGGGGRLVPDVWAAASHKVGVLSAALAPPSARSLSLSSAPPLSVSLSRVCVCACAPVELAGGARAPCDKAAA